MKFKIGFVLGAAALMVAAPITASAHDNGYHHRHENNNGSRILGTAIGAIAGGVLGSNLAAGDVQQEGTALGAVLGGAAGYAISADQTAAIMAAITIMADMVVTVIPATLHTAIQVMVTLHKDIKPIAIRLGLTRFKAIRHIRTRLTGQTTPHVHIMDHMVMDRLTTLARG